MVQVQVGNVTYKWETAELKTTLEALAAANKKSRWVKADLSTSPTKWWSRVLWKITKFIPLLRMTFFKVNLESSKAVLHQLRPHIAKDQTLQDCFKNAVSAFNTIAPSHSVDFTKTEEIYRHIKDGDANKLKGLLNRGNIETVNEKGLTLLHIALQHNHYSVIKLLVDKGANIHAEDTQGWGTLHHSRGYRARMLLLQYGADRNIYNHIRNDITGPYQANVGETPYNWTTEELEYKLKALSEAKINTHCIKADLTTTPLKRWQRVAWKVCKHFAFMRRWFFKENLEVSKELLHQLRPQIKVNKRLQTYFDKAVQAYNAMAPKHQVDFTKTDKIYQLMKEGKVKELEPLLTKATIETRNLQRQTLLHVAVLSHNQDLIELLLKKGANVNAKDKSEKTPLHYAHDLKEKKSLLQHGANVNIPNPETNQTLLHSSAKGNKISDLQLLLSKGGDVLAKDGEEKVPLHHATTPDAVKVLAKRSAVKARDVYGQTPLHCAHKLETIKAMVDAGADVNAEDKLGRTKMTTTSDTKVIEYLFNKGASGKNSLLVSEPYGPSFKIRAMDDPKLAKLALDHKASPNVTDPWGRSPLHMVKTLEVAKLLVQHGADVNLKDSFGETPLFCVEDPQIAEFLIRKGAKVDVKNTFGFGLLHEARNGAMAEVFIRHKLDINQRAGRNKETPLMKTERPDVATVLLNHKAETIDPSTGNSILHWNHNFEVVKVLAKSIDVNHTNKKGETPLHSIPCYNREYHLKVANYLVNLKKNRADPKAENNAGETPKILRKK